MEYPQDPLFHGQGLGFGLLFLQVYPGDLADINCISGEYHHVIRLAQVADIHYLFLLLQGLQQDPVLLVPPRVEGGEDGRGTLLRMDYHQHILVVGVLEGSEHPDVLLGEGDQRLVPCDDVVDH